MELKTKIFDITTKIAKWAFVVFLVIGAGQQIMQGYWVAGVCTVAYIIMLLPPVSKYIGVGAKVICFFLLVIIGGHFLQYEYDKKVLKLGCTHETVLEITKTGPSPNPRGEQCRVVYSVSYDGRQFWCEQDNTIEGCLEKALETIRTWKK
jgi:hypothetical protein